MTSGATASRPRRLAVGAEVAADGVHFRTWAPKRRRVEVLLEGGAVELRAESGGWFSGFAPGVDAGALYRLRLDRRVTIPDPASRFQPEGPHGLSEVVDPAFPWTDADWRGRELGGQVLYELHVGTFSPAGTWAAAAERLKGLADLGVTIVALMPVAEFAGAFGWGYDGVALFAPYHGYGRPAEFRAFVDRAHALGMAVILDVVYNHFGPDGNYLRELTDEFFSDTYTTDWGDAINFDGPGSGPVRDFYRANVRYWIEEYHLDGFRLDATQDIHDASTPHIFSELARTARSAAAPRAVLMIAENEPQDTRLIRPEETGGLGLDGAWNDDFHHTAVVALTGRREAYYSDYLGSPQELVSVAKRGFLYQGQRYEWQGKRRGTSTRGVPASAFVHYLENHDQVANSARGSRLAWLAQPARLRAMTALLLLMPGNPLLFQGQEFGSTRPFLYFADHRPDLAAEVRRGRAQFLRQFASLATEAMQRQLADPGDPATFRASVLDDAERAAGGEWTRLHRDLLRLRASDRALRVHVPDLDGAVLGGDALVLRWFGPGEDRLLLVNLGRDLHLSPAPEPLLGPWRGRPWRLLWSSEAPDYGGLGTPPVESEEGGWRVPGPCAVLMRPEGKDVT